MWRYQGALLFLRFLLLILPCIEGGTKLNEYIENYEPLTYSQNEIHHKHQRVKRWAGDHSSPEAPTLSLKFNAHNQNFHLRLKRDTSVFSSNVLVEGDGLPPSSEPLDLTHLYSGHLEGVPGSHVFGSIREGVFDGKIYTPKQTYYVERISKYPHLLSNNPTSNSTSLHSVIYADPDVHDPYEHLRSGHAKGCGITDEVMDWMENIQNSAVTEDELKHPKSKPFHRDGPTAQKLTSLLHEHEHDGYGHSYSKYFKEANTLYNISNSSPRASSFYKTENDESSSMDSDGSGRGRRALPSSLSSKTTCTLSIQTDPLLWKHIAEQEKPADETKIREEILSLIAQHVKAVNHIYSNTLFEGKEAYKNIRFEVQRIKIDTDKACRPDHKGEKNLFCIENIDVSNFLNLHSLTDHHAFCLAYVFTYRDFTGGTLGLAWVASASGASGGVCETYKTYTETIGGVYQSTRRSLNTGIITFVNYNSRVPPKVSQLTLAHEIGHNFGSPHDYPNRCRPGGSDGNFIMFASATSGDRPNNSKFSECSVKNISSVLDAIIHDQKKANCFIATNGTFCGNKIVEEGEECDCGYNDEECGESCCYPRQISSKDMAENPHAAGCKRRPHKRCSPSEGPCCDSTCNFIRLNDRQLCKHETECSFNSSCNGKSASCPTPAAKRDIDTSCNDGTQVCQSGECRGSICLKFGLRECFLSSTDKTVDKRKLCELACLDRNGKCKSTSELHLEGLPYGLSLRPGAPCDNFQGYCDVFLKCRAVDAEGPLARLKNLLFNKETLLNIAQWVTEYWWAVLLMGVGFIIVMGLFIKCCAVHTPSSNPKKAPARRIGDTLRRPISTLRRHRNANYRAANSAGQTANGHAGPSHHGHGAPPPPYSSSAPGPSAPAPTPQASSSSSAVPNVPVAGRSGGPPHGFGEGRGPNRGRSGNPSSNSGPTRGAHYGGGGGGGHKSHAQHRV